MAENELKVEDFGREFETSGVLQTTKGTVVPHGSKVAFVGGFTDPTDVKARKYVGGDFGTWNVYRVDTGEEGVERIHAEPGSTADQKARGAWKPPKVKR
ncbi:hypothetical protein ACFL0Y_00975 [Patescibacteria group bacterium]